MRVLNLYAGIGGNRKLWEGVEVTAVEHNEEIAAIYKEYFPDDNVIIGDAHEYLLKNYKEFDFVWTSRPCPTHSRANFWASVNKDNRDNYYPDLGLYQEIIFLKHWFKGKFVAENVEPYYVPLWQPDIKLGRHFFWSNFRIKPIEIFDEANIHTTTSNTVVYGFNLSEIKINHRKDQILRNCVNPDLGLYILEQAQGIIRQEKTKQTSLFKTDAA
jgi:DNA (cytosine-5)-methyltransferase 1